MMNPVPPVGFWQSRLTSSQNLRVRNRTSTGTSKRLPMSCRRVDGNAKRTTAETRGAIH